MCIPLLHEDKHQQEGWGPLSRIRNMIPKNKYRPGLRMADTHSASAILRSQEPVTQEEAGSPQPELLSTFLTTNNTA